MGRLVDGAAALPVGWVDEAEALVVADRVDVEAGRSGNLFDREFVEGVDVCSGGLHGVIVGVNAHRVDAQHEMAPCPLRTPDPVPTHQKYS